MNASRSFEPSATGGPTRDGKLVRDRIPTIIEASGRVPKVRRLEPSELVSALIMKLEEEAQEFLAANHNEQAEELADILEVVRALADQCGLDMSDLERIADTKRAERGGFKLGLWLVNIDSE